MLSSEPNCEMSYFTISHWAIFKLFISFTCFFFNLPAFSLIYLLFLWFTCFFFNLKTQNKKRNKWFFFLFSFLSHFHTDLYYDMQLKFNSLFWIEWLCILKLDYFSFWNEICVILMQIKNDYCSDVLLW